MSENTVTYQENGIFTPQQYREELKLISENPLAFFELTDKFVDAYNTIQIPRISTFKRRTTITKQFQKPNDGPTDVVDLAIPVYLQRPQTQGGARDKYGYAQMKYQFLKIITEYHRGIRETKPPTVFVEPQGMNLGQIVTFELQDYRRIKKTQKKHIVSELHDEQIEYLVNISKNNFL